MPTQIRLEPTFPPPSGPPKFCMASAWIRSAGAGGPSRESTQAILDAARRAVPHQAVPHPCTVRCWRVGAPSGLDERGRCLECGSPGVRSDKEEYESLVSPEVVASLCEQLMLFRDAVEHPAVLAAAAVGAP